MKIRIQNDGKPGYATQLTDVETGNAIEGIRRVDLTIDVRGMPTALLTAIGPVVDVIADAEVQRVCPVCGKSSEQPPTAKMQDAEVAALVKAWEDTEEAERERDERKRKMLNLIRNALYDMTPGIYQSDHTEQLANDLYQSLAQI